MSTRGAGEGTREYQAPEQIAREKRVDVRADIYSVGVILFELLTGELPFNGPLVEAQVADTARYAPTPREINPTVNRDLEAICEKCLQKSAEKRFESATALADDLNRFLQGEPILTRPITGRERVQRFLWFHRVAVGFSAALLLSVTIGGGVGIRQYLENRRIDLERTASLREQDRLKQEGEALAAKKQAAEEAAKQKDVKIAEQQERVEQEQSATAIAKRNNQLHEYASDMQTVQRSWNEGNQSQVAELLVRHDPSKNGGASDVRGFEWYYWNHLLHQKDGTIQNGAACRCLTVNEGGRLLAVSDFENVTVWNLEGGVQLWRRPVTGRRKTLFSQDRSIPTDRSVAFSRDGRWVAGTGFVIEEQRRLGTLKVWDAQSGDEVFSVVDDPGINGRTLVFAPDGERILAGGYMNGWKSWNLKTKKSDLESTGEIDGDAVARPRSGGLGASPFQIVRFLGFSEDGDRLFASSDSKNPSLSWPWPGASRRTGPPEQGLRSEARGVPEWGGRLPAGVIRAASDRPWRVVNIEDSKLHLYGPSGRGPNRPVFGVTGAPNKQLRDAVLAPPERATCVDLRGPRLVAGGADQLVYLWQLDEGNGNVISNEVLRGHRETITAVTLSPEGKPISGDNGGEIRLWTDSQPEIVTVDGGSQTMTIAPRSDRGVIEVTSAAGSVVGRIPMEKQEHLFGARPSTSERYVLLSIQGTPRPPRNRLVVWDLQESRAVVMHVYGPKLIGVDDLALSGDESTLAAVTDGKNVILWSTKTGAELGSLTAPEYAALALNETGSYLAVGGNKRLPKDTSPIQVWDVARREKLSEIAIASGEAHRAPVFVFSADGEKLIVDGNPSTLWDVRTGKQLPATLGDILADSAQTSQDRRRLYFITGDTVEICCAKTFRPLLKFTMKVTGRTRELSRRDAVGGARGFWASEVLDRRLTQLVETWRHEDAR
jgi:WD40 repeat protein